MKIEYLFLIIFCFAAISAWSMTIWGGWAEKYCTSQIESSTAWFWFRVFKIDASIKNRVRFIKIVSGLGIALILLGTILSFLSIFTNVAVGSN